MKNNIIQEILDEIPLKIAIKTTIQMQNLSFLSDIGLREAKSWGPDEDELLEKIMEHSRKTYEWVLKDLEEYDININKIKEK